MKRFDLKRTLNLHKYSMGIQQFISEWKVMLPLLLSVSAIIVGTFLIKGESGLYNKIAISVEEYLHSYNDNTLYVNLLINLLVPTSFAIIIFFFGLSVYGGLLANLIPFFYGLIAGIITYYMYSEYTLKGLAFCVIMVFPYVTLSLFSLILITAECITMSQHLMFTLSQKKRKTPDYSINKYYINSIKSYIIIVIAVIIKTGIEYLFSGLFRF